MQTKKWMSTGLMLQLVAGAVLGGLCLPALADDKEDIQSAIARWKAAVDVNPNNPTTRIKLGNFYLLARNAEDAIHQFKNAARLAPDNAEPHIGLARAYMQNRQIDQAIVEYKEATRLEPNQAEYAYKLGIAYYSRGRDDDAIAAFRQGVKADPKHAACHRQLGALLGLKGDTEAQINEEKKAIELAPNDSDAYFYLASGYFVQAKLDQNQAAKAAKPGPGDDGNRGYDAKDLKYLEEARKNFEKSIQLNPQYAQAHHMLAITLGAQKNFDQAVKSEETAIKLEPANADYKQTLKKLRARQITKG